MTNKKKEKNDGGFFGIEKTKDERIMVSFIVIAITIFLILPIHYDIIFNNSETFNIKYDGNIFKLFFLFVLPIVAFFRIIYHLFNGVSGVNFLNKNLRVIGIIFSACFVIFAIFAIYQINTFYKYKDRLIQLSHNHESGLLPLIGECVDDPLKKVSGLENKKNSDCNLDSILNKIDKNVFSFLLKEDEKTKLVDKIITKNNKANKNLSIIKNNSKTKISKVKKETKISGCLEGDCNNSFSKKEYSNGYYIGEFENKEENGQGTFVWTVGDKYIGEWKDGNRTGQGKYIWTNGDQYTGDFLNGEKHGKGTFVWDSGNKFEGEWKFDEKNGQGIFVWANSGDKYIGSYLGDKRTGRGTYIWQDNTIYVGTFYENEMVHGIQTNPDGKKLLISKIDGEIKVRLIENTNQAQKVDLLIKQLKRNNDLQTSRMLLDISKSLMGNNQNSSSLKLSNPILDGGWGWNTGSSTSGMYKTCYYKSSLGTKTKTVFASAPCPMAY